MSPRQSRPITRSNVAVFSIQMGIVTISIPPRAVPKKRTATDPRVIIAIFRAELSTVVIIQAITYKNKLLLKIFANCRDIYKLQW